MNIGNKDPFKHKNEKDLMKFFDHIPAGIVEWVYHLFYFSAVGVLSMYGTEEGQEMMERFQVFLAEAEQLAAKSEKEKETLKNGPLAVDPKNWKWNKA